MYRAVMLADVHCSNSLPHAKRDPQTMVTDRLLDTIDILSQVTTYCKGKGVADVYILGDLFDKRLADAVTLKMVTAALKDMIDCGLNLFLVPGNHEASDCSGRHFIMDAMVEIGCWVAGTSAEGGALLQPRPGAPAFLPMPHQPDKLVEDYLRKALETCPDAIPLLHQSIQGGKMGNWVCPDGLDLEMLSKFPAVISGHFHTRQRLGVGKVMYLGAPLQHNFGDEGELDRGWSLVSIGDGDITVTAVPSKSPRFHTFDIDGAKPNFDWLLSGGESDYVMVKSVDLEKAKSVCFSLLNETHVRSAKPALITKAQRPRVRLKTTDNEVGRVTWQSALSDYVDAVKVEGVDRRALLQKGMELINGAESTQQ